MRWGFYSVCLLSCKGFADYRILLLEETSEIKEVNSSLIL